MRGVFIADDKSNDVLADFVITGDVQPFKMERYTAAENWLWDPFSFENGIVKDIVAYQSPVPWRFM